MAIKMTMADGTIIEGTAEELALLQKATEEGALGEEKLRFEIGDYVVPTSSKRYVITSKPHMKLGKVVSTRDLEGVDDIHVEVVAIDEGRFSSRKGENYSVNSKYFEKADDETIARYTREPSGVKPLKVGDIARVVGNTFSGKVGKGRIVEIIRDADYEGDYRIETEDGSGDYAKVESLSKLETDDTIGAGDIVRTTEYRNGFPVGTLGEVVAVDGDGWVRVRAIMRPADFITFGERNVELVAKASDRADIDV